MPNHVTNAITASAEVLAYLRTNEQIVDFNTVLPSPDDDEPLFTAEKTEFRNKDGHIFSVGWGFDGYSPMDWARENWGTKWNAYDIKSISPTEVRFHTAWSHPFPVIEALALVFPDEAIRVTYADEDLGYNFGAYVRIGSDIFFAQSPADGSAEAKELTSQFVYGEAYNV